MISNPPLVVGPFLGELGWEIISWQPMVRSLFMQGRHERCIVFGKPGRSLLYPFAEYIDVPDLPKYEEECLLWSSIDQQRKAELDAIGSQCLAKGKELTKGSAGWFWYDRLNGVFNQLNYMQGRPDVLYGDGSAPVDWERGKLHVVLCVRDRELSSFRNYHYADWYTLADSLVKDGHQVVVIGMVRGDDWEMPDGVTDLTNRTTINDCVNLFQGADVAVGANTGIIHLACRCGTAHVSWGQQPQDNGIDKVRQRLAETNWTGAFYHGIHDQGWSPPPRLVQDEVNRAFRPKPTKGRVLLTFDDGMADHYRAAKWMATNGIKGAFSFIGSMVGTPGYLTRHQMERMREMGHAICSHSWGHRRLGRDEAREHMEESSPEDIVADAVRGAKWVQRKGWHNGHIAPFGTQNINGQEHLDKMTAEFDWIRLTVGAPLEGGGWTWEGNKRLYPVGYKNKVIGITVAADVRFPDEVREKVADACRLPALCVVAYHSTNHPVGNTQALTWGRFLHDMEYIRDKVAAGELECVLPEDVS